MIIFSDVMERVLPLFRNYLVVFLLLVLILLLPLISLFTFDNFYRFAYWKNGAYDRLGFRTVQQTTDEFQGFLLGKNELVSFPPDEKNHLLEVREVYDTGLWLIRFDLMLLVLLLVLSGMRIGDFTKVLKRTVQSLVGVTALLFLLGLNWNWFFTGFHELLFKGNWIFSQETLMIKLWGGNFFMVAALAVLIDYLLVGMFLYGLERTISTY